MSSSLLNKILSSPTAPTPASNRACKNSNNDDDDESSSYFQRTVCLYDWWLIKAEKDFESKRLAVAGFTSRELQAMRLFTSAPIVKRYDVFTLETADGICIVIKGFINKSRTMENGFSSEVFSHFVFGFPPYWEAYTEKLPGKEFSSGTGTATGPDFNNSATVLEPVAGMENSSLNTTPSKYKKENDKSKHNIEDISECSENVSERIINNDSRGPDSTNHTAEHKSIDNAKNYTSENLPPSIGCVLNTVSLLEDNFAVPAEPSGHPVTESFERMVNSESNRKDNEGIVRKSKSKGPANLESATIINAALGESPVPKDADNLNPSRGNSVVEIITTSCSPKTSQMQKENGRNKDGLNCGNKNCSTAYLPQDTEAIVRCAGEKSSGVESSNLLSSSCGIMHNDSLSTSPIVGDPNVPEVSGNGIDHPMIFPVVHSAINMNIITPSQVDANAVNIASSNTGSGKTSSGLRNWKSKQKEHSGFIGSGKHKSKELSSEVSELLDGENLKRCSSDGTNHAGRKTDASEAILSQSMSRVIKDLLGNSKGKRKKRVTVICGLKAKRNEMNSVSLISDRMSNTMQNNNLERMKIFDMCDEELQDPTYNIVAKDNPKQRQDRRKISRTGTPRHNLNNLPQYPSGPGDKNHRSNLKTAVGEKERNAKEVGSSRKKAQRKINFDAHASPRTHDRKEKISVVSPESLSLKRSRSGRLLLPSLDFWRNQIAVYDADRKITGIQEAVDDVKPSKGNKSEPRKKRRRWTKESQWEL